MMQYRTLGNTGLQVSAFSLGSWQTFGQTVSDAATLEIMARAFDAGINCFDGAEVYGRPRGSAERVMGACIKELGWRRDQYIITSKVGNMKFEEPTRQRLHRKHIVESCEGALQRFNTDHLDLFYCHAPDPITPPREIVRSMNLLITQGKILHWATSNHAPEVIAEMHQAAAEMNMEGPVCEQSYYNVLGRGRLEEQLAPLMSGPTHMGFFAYCPLAGGILTGKYADGIPEDSRFGTIAKSHTEREQFLNQVEASRQMAKVADELECSLLQLALAWVLDNPMVSSALLGISKPHYLEENLKALEVLSRIEDSHRSTLTNIYKESGLA